MPRHFFPLLGPSRKVKSICFGVLVGSSVNETLTSPVLTPVHRISLPLTVHRHFGYSALVVGFHTGHQSDWQRLNFQTPCIAVTSSADASGRPGCKQEERAPAVGGDGEVGRPTDLAAVGQRDVKALLVSTSPHVYSPTRFPLVRAVEERDVDLFRRPWSHRPRRRVSKPRSPVLSR